MLESQFSGVPLELMKRMIFVKESSSGEGKVKGGGKGKGKKYSDELVAFALTLQFYSSKAYDYVRKTFDLALPAQQDIRRRYAKIEADPGFTEPAFTELRKKTEEAKLAGKEVICSLMLDEMAIKKNISFDGKKYRGYVDLGNEIDDDTLPPAKEALVFMVVCVNSSWKVPCAYFLIDSLDGTTKANLIKICIQRLSDVGIRVISVTCDGPSAHFKMFKELGASLEPENLNTTFPHPNHEEKYHIYALLDICHMLKLVRNTLADHKILLDHENKQICWGYIEALSNLQESEGLRLANKLTKSHIRWYQQKMKVNLAAQVFSSSVADALEFSTKVIKEENIKKQFVGCEATVTFIRVINRLFDVLNSKNPYAKGTKAPMSANNKDEWSRFFYMAYNYILGLKNQSGTKIIKTKRKTGFIGFLVGIKSFQGIFHDLVEIPNAPLNYILTYKYSQDHLELFFGAVRSAGGSNNNPTAPQFINIYRRLLLRSSIQGGKGNVTPRDSTKILHLMNDICKVDGKKMTTSEAGTLRNYEEELEEISLINDADYNDALEVDQLSEFKTQIISYIAGYVVKMTIKQIACVDCCQVLCSKKPR